jgi:hypothetical protein
MRLEQTGEKHDDDEPDPAFHANVDAVIRHYKAINDGLEAQLAVALAQRDAWRSLSTPSGSAGPNKSEPSAGRRA